MKSSSIQLLLAGVAVCIILTFFMTPTYGSSIVIGGNWTDIGTITFVSPKPGDSPTTAGTALLNTINGITDNSAANPYLIKLGPGVYDIGTSSLQMTEYVDIEGSGENVTTITGNVGFSTAGVVRGANNAEIRFLTVQNTGGVGIYAIAIFNSSASPKITNVTASASGVDTARAVYNSSSSPAMTNVTVSASGTSSGYGVFNNGGAAKMNNVTVSASGGTNGYGVYNSGAATPNMNNVTISASGGAGSYGVSNAGTVTIRINHSVIKASTNTIYNNHGNTTYVSNTQLDGGAASNSGTLTCAGVYDENYTFYASACP